MAFDFAGVPAVREQALTVLGKRGRLVLVGLAQQPVTIPSDTLFAYLGQAVLGHYGSEPEHVRAAGGADPGRAGWTWPTRSAT